MNRFKLAWKALTGTLWNEDQDVYISHSKLRDSNIVARNIEFRNCYITKSVLRTDKKRKFEPPNPTGPPPRLVTNPPDPRFTYIPTATTPSWGVTPGGSSGFWHTLSAFPVSLTEPDDEDYY